MPFLAALPALAGLIGRFAGNAAKGSQDQRLNENALANQRNSILANIYGTNQAATMNAAQAGANERLQQAQTDLDQRRFALAAPGARASQTVRGSLMERMQPSQITGLDPRIAHFMPQISGGLTPEAFSPQVREMGRLLQRDAVMGQLNGDTFAPQTPTNFSSAVLSPPQLAELQRSGLLEKILGGVGLAGSLVGGIGDLYHQQRTPPMVTPPKMSLGEG